MASEYGLDSHFESFVREQISTGRYGDARDVLHEALRLMEDRERHGDILATFRRVWNDGVGSGDAGPVDIEGIKRQGRASLEDSRR